MGNHLRDLIESTKRRDVSIVPWFGSAVWRGAIKAVAERGEQAMCFDIGHTADVGKFPPPALIRLPYQVCWLEGDVVFLDESRSDIAGWLCIRADDCPETFEFFEWVRVDRAWLLMGVGRVCDGALSFCVTSHSPEHDETIAMTNHESARFVLALAALNCSNIVTRRHDPDQKLQKARAWRGKKPLFSYHTLEIDPQASRDAGVDQGGTHASPRVHLRRGHIRKFAPGKWCWVRETIVRGITPGMVHKDYALKGAVH